MRYKVKFGLLLMILHCMIISCIDETTSQAKDIDSVEQLFADKDFVWIAGLKGKLLVSFINPTKASLEGEIIHIIDEDGQVFEKARIYDNVVSFDVVLPQNTSYYLYFPVTGDKVLIDKIGDMEIELGATIPESNELKSSSIDSDEFASCTSCANPMINSGAERPIINRSYKIISQDQVPGWETTASDKKIEIWTDGFNGVPSQEGQQFFELNANRVADLYQELCLEPGSTIKWSVWHRGRAGVDKAVVKIGATVESSELVATMIDGTDEWGYYTGKYTVPENQTNTFFVFSSVSSAGSRSVGNFLDNFEIECDFDGDGVPDDEDDADTDPNVTYVSSYPTSGKEIVAFEDLWPSFGDFDFNDLVMSNQVQLYKDLNFNLINADFTVSIDGIGANINNGIGMMLYDEDGNPFGEDIISSVAGDVTLDPDNTNGLILLNNVYETISKYYQNNGVGPSAVPDTLKFTVNFNENVKKIVPELYLFRSSDKSYQIHRSEFPVPGTMNQSLFNSMDDVGHYKSNQGLPWGLGIIIIDGNLRLQKKK